MEKVGITVEDAPFVAVDFTAEGGGADQRLTFITQVEDEVAAGPEHPIRVTRDPGHRRARALRARSVRDLEALIDRKSFYRLVELGDRARGRRGQFGVWSGGVFFPFMPAAELEDAKP